MSVDIVRNSPDGRAGGRFALIEDRRHRVREDFHPVLVGQRRGQVPAQHTTGMLRRNVAQKFDRELTDVFVIQDEVTLAIVGAMRVNLTDGEVARLEEGETHNLDAWESFHRGALEFLKYTKESNSQARRMFEHALEFDPNYLDAKIYLAFTHCMDARSGYVTDRAGALSRANTLLEEIKATGVESANANHMEAFHNLMNGNYDKALHAAEIANNLGPCRMFGFAPSAQVYMYCGDSKTAVKLLRTSMRLSPFSPPDVLYFLAYASSWNGDHENAIRAAEEYARRIPGDIYAYVLLAIVFGLAGRRERSSAAIKILRRHFPTYSLGDFLSHESYRDPRDLERIAQILSAAGMPEN